MISGGIKSNGESWAITIFSDQFKITMNLLIWTCVQIYAKNIATVLWLWEWAKVVELWYAYAVKLIFTKITGQFRRIYQRIILICYKLKCLILNFHPMLSQLSIVSNCYFNIKIICCIYILISCWILKCYNKTSGIIWTSQFKFCMFSLNFICIYTYTIYFTTRLRLSKSTKTIKFRYRWAIDLMLMKTGRQFWWIRYSIF